MFGVTRPLKALAAAATADRPRRNAARRCRRRGASEIGTVGRAFNQMSRDLQQLDADRALILAGVSHDLRTPLARLRLSVEMSGADEATRESMNEDIDDMDKVIGQFLDFARETSGEPIQPRIWAPCVSDVAEATGAAACRCRRDGEPLPDMPHAAVGAAPPDRQSGGQRPALCRRARSRSNSMPARQDDQVLIEVQDRGPGIPPDQVERLKRPFTRLETARSDASGAGLGLAIVDRIARTHGGSFDLLPRPGGGLIARVMLPVAAAAPAGP